MYPAAPVTSTVPIVTSSFPIVFLTQILWERNFYWGRSPQTPL